jgi:SagB-type dehydrogenase family enzyme
MIRRQRIRRSSCLWFFWSDGALYAANYLTGVHLPIPLAVLGVLNHLNVWRTPDAVARTLAGSTKASVRALLDSLEKTTLIVREGSAQDARERQLGPWRAWGEEARAFHFITKRTHQRPPESDETALVRSLLDRDPLPPAVKRYNEHRQIALDKSDQRVFADFPQLLLRRRIRRQFSAQTVSLADISFLLRLTWGFTGSREWPGLGRVGLKTSPSGGARHPIEVYVAPLGVKGLPRSLYYYHPLRHSLIDLRTRITASDLERFCGYQPWTRRAAALFLMTAVIPRITWRYRSSRAYRVMLLEAGHFCQTFCLLATWLNLAPFSTAALDDEYIEQRLGLDGSSETVLYAAGVGALPRTNSSSRDPSARAPRKRPTRL